MKQWLLAKAMGLAVCFSTSEAVSGDAEYSVSGLWCEKAQAAVISGCDVFGSESSICSELQRGAAGCSTDRGIIRDGSVLPVESDLQVKSRGISDEKQGQTDLVLLLFADLLFVAVASRKLLGSASRRRFMTSAWAKENERRVKLGGVFHHRT